MVLALLIAVTALPLGMLLPWWSVFLPGILWGALAGRKSGASFLSGFAGIGILWLLQSAYIHVANNAILPNRIAELFSLPSPYILIVITVFIGGLIGGLTTLTGFLFRRVIFNP